MEKKASGGDGRITGRLCGPRRQLCWRGKRLRGTPPRRRRRRESPLSRLREKFLLKEVCARRSFRPKEAERSLLPYPRVSRRKGCKRIRRRGAPCTPDMRDYGKAIR